MIYIPDNKAEWAYESMACFVKDWYRMPGVENAFGTDGPCKEQYLRICDLLETKFDPDDDEEGEIREEILTLMGEIQREVAFRMFRLGMRFALDSRNA